MSSESTLEKDSKAKARAAELAEEVDERDEDEDEDGDDAPSATATRRKSEPSLPKEKVVVDRPSTIAMIWTITRRELASYFNSVITYTVVAASMLVLGFMFYMYKGGFWQVNRVTMGRMWEYLPIALCLIVIPLFTMRTLSDEKRVGTIELLITMPVKDSEVITGKYLAALAVVGVQLLLFVLYPIAMFKWPWHLGELDWGTFWVGMLGLFLLSSAGTAVGLMFSSFTESQILSFFLTMVVLMGLYALGFLSAVESLQGWPGDAVAFISLNSRLEPFTKGIIDTRAIVYFLSITVLCLLVAFHALERRKWA